MTDQSYNFAYLDEDTKRMITARSEGDRGASLSGALYFASREMPMPYGWGPAACG